MCGICGFVDGQGRTPNKALLKKANDLLDHRGPDDEGEHCDSALLAEGDDQPFYKRFKNVVNDETRAGEPFRMIDLHVSQGLRHIARYLGDGLVVSTPAGTTVPLGCG